MNIVIKPFNPSLDYVLPKYATDGSVGADLNAILGQPLTINPLQRILVPTNLCIELPQFFEAQIRPRSGLALKNGITVLNSPGTIDSDYRGEIKIILINLSNEPFVINHKDRVAQLIISPIVKSNFILSLDELSTTDRNHSGFGSSGK
jgi:dUTP pyrophosphatase